VQTKRRTGRRQRRQRRKHIFEATTNLQTLADLEYQRNIKGNNGTHGKGSARNGATGEDTVVLVPCGTIIYDAMTNEGLADLVEPGDRFLAARGGRGGRGNRYFPVLPEKPQGFARMVIWEKKLK
jgi:Predicted GTPase